MVSTGRNKLFYFFWEYLFPCECLICDKELNQEEYLCSSCFDTIEYFKSFPCFICNRGTFDSGICPACSEKTKINNIFVATKYTDSVAGKVVEAVKYNFMETMVGTMSAILEKAIDDKNYLLNALLIPIPLHRKRFAERGFNQAEELARRLAIKYNCDVDEKLIKRVKYTGQQAKLDRDGRLVNLKDAFFCTGQPSEKVIIVDDVLTTGSTFVEAAKVLNANGAKEIYCVAVCHG